MDPEDMKHVFEVRRRHWREGLEDLYLALALLVIFTGIMLALARAGVLH